MSDISSVTNPAITGGFLIEECQVDEDDEDTWGA